MFVVFLDKLTMLPTKQAFVSQIMNAVSKITQSMVNASKVIDFRGSLKDFEKYGFNLLRYQVNDIKKAKIAKIFNK